LKYTNYWLLLSNYRCEVEFELVDYFSIESEVVVVCDEDVVFWEELITFLDADIIYDNIGRAFSKHWFQSNPET
jgi:hypothetical protein